MKWQPTSSAPRGEYVLLYFGPKTILADHYWPGRKATHWMPMPDPPAAEEDRHCEVCGEKLVRRKEGDQPEGRARWERRSWCSSSCKRSMDRASNISWKEPMT